MNVRSTGRLLSFTLISGIAACGGGGTAPTAPATPLATPVPSPSANPFAAACGNPLPSFSDSYGFGIKVQLEPSPGKKILNASPIVKNAGYVRGLRPGTFDLGRRPPEPLRTVRAQLRVAAGGGIGARG
jgi:hypothetical protein